MREGKTLKVIAFAGITNKKLINQVYVRQIDYRIIILYIDSSILSIN